MKHIVRLLWLAILLPLRTPADPTPAAERPPMPAMEAGRIADDTIAAQLAGVTAQRFPNADSVYVNGYDTEFYREDGTGESWSEALIAILTEKGRRDYQTLSFGFHEAYGDVRITRLDLHKADGRVIPVDVKTQSRIMVAPDQMASNIFDPREKRLQVGLPGLEPGDAIRLVCVRRDHKARMENSWGNWVNFEGTDPILQDHLEVYAPAGRPLKHLELKDEVPGTVRYEVQQLGAWTLHRWTAENVPQIFEEPNMPPAHTVTQRLLLSTLDDWPSVSRWYWNLAKPRLESVTPEMTGKVAELTKGMTDRDAKIRAIFQFVSQQIRYMGLTPEAEAPGYEPHDVSLTFENRYGVCRDKAALLTALLRIAGIEAFPVLIHTGPRKDGSVPLPYFNHAITAVRHADGSYQLMDSTDETTRDLLPGYLCNKSYLVATPEGDILRTSPVPPATNNLLRIETHGRLQPDGHLAGTTVLHFDGINDNTYRGYLARAQPEEQKRLFEGLLKRSIAGARMTGWSLEPKDLQDLKEPLTARIEFDAADFPLTGATAGLLPAPWFGTGAGMVNFILGRTGLPERRYPLMTDMACGVHEIFRIELPPDLAREITPPTSKAIRRSTMEWSQTITTADGRLDGESEFLILAPEFSPGEYRQLKQDLRDIETARRAQTILTDPAHPAAAAQTAQAADLKPDTELEKDDIELELLGPGQWRETRTLTRRILTYAGVKDHSEIKIAFQPQWDSVRVPVARVIAADGTVRDAGEAETNLMDAEWVASAPRYAPERILVINLPGVEIGCRTDVKIVREFRDRPFVSGQIPLQGFDPAEERSLRIRFPATPGLQWSEPIAPEIALESRRGSNEVEWTLRQIPALPREDDLPPLSAFAPTVLFSDGSWTGLTAAANRILHAAVTDQEQALRQAGELLHALPRTATEADRVRAIRDFVVCRIRQAGPESGDVLWNQISPADKTLKEGYGHSADLAILQYALLRGAGFEPHFLLASSPALSAPLRNPFERTPQLSLFSTLLVAVTLDEGTAILNDTDQYAPLFATPFAGALALDLDAGGFRTIRARADEETATRTDIHMRLDPDGLADMTVRRTYRGMDAAAFHRRWTEMTPEWQSRYKIEEISELSQNAVPVGEWTINPSDASETFSLRIDHFAVRDGKRMYLTLPSLSGNVLGLRAEHRSAPLLWTPGMNQEAVITVAFPEGVSDVELMPETLCWQTPCGSVRGDFTARKISDNPLTLQISRSKKSLPGLLPSACYPEVFELNRRLSHPVNRTILVRAAAETASEK